MSQELCEMIAETAFEPLKDPRTDALFRTGPGPFTDTVVKHAQANPLSKTRGQLYKIRVLPRVVFGGLPPGYQMLSSFNEPGRAIVHWSIGTWKTSDFGDSWSDARLSKMRALELMQVPAISELGEIVYPVSTITKPSFVVMSHLIGHGDKQVIFI